MLYCVVKKSKEGRLTVRHCDDKRALQTLVVEEGIRVHRDAATASQWIHETAEGEEVLIFRGEPFELQAKYSVI